MIARSTRDPNLQTTSDLTVNELPIGSKRHVMEFLKPVFLCGFTQLIEHRFQFIVAFAEYKNSAYVSVLWFICRRCHSVGRR
jgi:hypothetical protein